MKPNPRKSLGERLRAAREYLGLSQEEVASQIGVPRPAISQMENANRRVEAVELSKLARLYQKPVSYFTGEELIEEPLQLELLKRAAAELSEGDRNEVLKFAQYLRARSDQAKEK